MALITTERHDDVTVVAMAHQSKLNALSAALVKEIVAALHQARDDKARALILRAAPGMKIWSAGHDVRELPLGRRDPLGWSDPLRRLIREIEELPLPVIALCEGGVWGGACEVALTCDLVIAAPTATFALTPAKLGVPYNATGLLTFLNTVGLHILKEMAFTAEAISAERAARFGIVNHVVASAEIEDFTLNLARRIARNAPLSIGVIKEQLRTLASAHSMTPRMFERIQGLRRVVYDSRDYEEGVRAFLEKRPPVFTGE